MSSRPRNCQMCNTNDSSDIKLPADKSGFVSTMGFGVVEFGVVVVVVVVVANVEAVTLEAGAVVETEVVEAGMEAGMEGRHEIRAGLTSHSLSIGSTVVPSGKYASFPFSDFTGLSGWLVRVSDGK